MHTCDYILVIYLLHHRVVTENTWESECALPNDQEAVINCNAGDDDVFASDWSRSVTVRSQCVITNDGYEVPNSMLMFPIVCFYRINQ